MECTTVLRLGEPHVRRGRSNRGSQRSSEKGDESRGRRVGRMDDSSPAGIRSELDQQQGAERSPRALRYFGTALMGSGNNWVNGIKGRSTM